MVDRMDALLGQRSRSDCDSSPKRVRAQRPIPVVMEHPSVFSIKRETMCMQQIAAHEPRIRPNGFKAPAPAERSRSRLGYSNLATASFESTQERVGFNFTARDQLF
eukprot:4826059-Pleurochrysis_carterae.AAC.6